MYKECYTISTIVVKDTQDSKFTDFLPGTQNCMTLDIGTKLVEFFVYSTTVSNRALSEGSY